MLFFRTFSVLALLLISSSLFADLVPISNASFEEYVLTDGGLTSDGVGTLGWSTIESPAPVNSGVWNPTTGPSGSFSTVPDGENVLYAWTGTYYQILTETVAVNTTYTLQVDVGKNRGNPFAPYKTQLWAGNVLLVEDGGSLTPSSGEWLTSEISYTTRPSDTFLGAPLEIRLISLGGNTPETDFDNVRLDASAIPLTAAGWFLGSGLLGLVGFLRRERIT